MYTYKQNTFTHQRRNGRRSPYRSNIYITRAVLHDSSLKFSSLDATLPYNSAAICVSVTVRVRVCCFVAYFVPYTTAL